jgi:hypothetical protein
MSVKGWFGKSRKRPLGRQLPKHATYLKHSRAVNNRSFLRELAVLVGAMYTPHNGTRAASVGEASPRAAVGTADQALDDDGLAAGHAPS